MTDGLPFVLNRRGDECFLTVSIDRAFQVVISLVVYSTAEQERAFKPACFESFVVQKNTLRHTGPRMTIAASYRNHRVQGNSSMDCCDCRRTKQQS